jgi:threonine dehydratase
MITLDDIRQATRRLGDRVLRTPLIFSPSLSERFNAQIYLKLENLQKTGSFKIRGATNKILAERKSIGSAGVVAASAGNHAQGVALAASQAGLPAAIVMPEWASISKQEATRSYGGQVIICGQNVGESLDKARDLAQNGAMFVHPYDDPLVIAGQGTIGLEILDALADADLILVPVGGGGLIAGIATAVRAIRPAARVVGVQAAACPAAAQAVDQGRRVTVAGQSSIADGISVKQIGQLTFDIIRRQVESVLTVDEAQIASAILMLLERKKVLAEGAGAVSLAALLAGVMEIAEGSKVVLVISGGNLDSPLLGRIINQGLVKHGRIMRFGIQLDDTPGSLARLLTLAADLKANVLRIYHDRYVRNQPLYKTRVELELETRGIEHMAAVAAGLKNAGYGLELF